MLRRAPLDRFQQSNVLGCRRFDQDHRALRQPDPPPSEASETEVMCLEEKNWLDGLPAVARRAKVGTGMGIRTSVPWLRKGASEIDDERFRRFP